MFHTKLLKLEQEIRRGKKILKNKIIIIIIGTKTQRPHN
jgi:hypothetical protein